MPVFKEERLTVLLFLIFKIFLPVIVITSIVLVVFIVTKSYVGFGLRELSLVLSKSWAK
jgi:hypothetical protein